MGCRAKTMALMRLSTSQKLVFALLAFAGLMMFPSWLRAPVRAASSARSGNEAAREAGAIRLRRGALDTRARRDLDTSAQDRHAASAELAALNRATPAELRLVQFAGPIKNRWLDQLEAAGAELVGYVPDYAYLIRATPAALNRVALLDAGEVA